MMTDANGHTGKLGQRAMPSRKTLSRHFHMSLQTSLVHRIMYKS